VTVGTGVSVLTRPKPGPLQRSAPPNNNATKGSRRDTQQDGGHHAGSPPVNEGLDFLLHIRSSLWSCAPRGPYGPLGANR